MTVLSDIEEKLLTDKYNIILKEDTGRLTYNNKKIIILLSNSILHLIDYNTFINKNIIKEIKKININGIIGVNIRNKDTINNNNSSNNICIMTIYSYNYIKPSSLSSLFFSSNENKRKREVLHIEFNNVSQKVHETWKNAINHIAYNSLSDYNGSSNSNSSYDHHDIEISIDKTGNSDIFQSTYRKRYIVFVNPVSGSGLAQKIWKNQVLPIFKEAGVEYLEIITAYANHAKTCMFNGKVDSSFANSNVNIFEYYDVVVTIGGDGLICEVINGIMDRPDCQEIFNKITIAPINGGSGNGLVKSILFANKEEYSIVNATINALKGVPSPMDLSEICTSTSKRYHSFLTVSWGLVADIDILSEKMRCLGETRLYVAAVYFILKAKVYKGRLSMYTGNKAEFSSEKLPPLNVPIQNSDGWTVIESNFSLVWVLQTSHAASTMLSGPGKKLDDGEFMIMVVEKISRVGLLQLLVSFDTGGHVNHPSVKIYKASAYRLEPLCQEGIIACDGEKINYCPLQAIMHPGAAKISLKQ